MKKLKIRPECLSCKYFSGKTPADATCAIGENPNCYRKKKICKRRINKEKEKSETSTALSKEPISDTKKIIQKADTEDAKNDIKPLCAVAYTDGSYNAANKRYGYGVVFLIGNEQKEFMGSGYDQYNGWQIMGEIQGALRACTEARKIGVEELEIRYDYEGIRCWADGEWRCKKPYTIQYARDIKEFRKYMKIKFVHVKAHTGISGNESADNLAKTACEINPGVKIPDTTPGYVPEIPESCNKGCREAIISFYQKKAHTFKDYIALKTFGLDDFSTVSHKEAIAYAKQNNFDELIENYGCDSSIFCKIIRWCMRGLLPDDAVYKVVKVDAEIAANIKKS